ncbi:MAG: class I SAM-dependent methyltransferase [Pseudomonadota bacterium]
MKAKPDLQSAYALEGPEANLKLYADWAKSYDQSFAQETDYQSPTVVARAYAALGFAGPVLDLGAGTGLVGEELCKLGPFEIDATDLSAEMLAVAEAKQVYRRLFQGDLTRRLDIMDGHYTGAVSAGTFTHGHVGPNAMAEVLRILHPGGAAVLTVNAEHWQAKGFEAALDRLSDKIAETTRSEFALYGEKATGSHAHDKGILLTLIRA